MKNNEITKVLIESNEALFGKMSEKKLNKLVKEIIAVVGTNIDNMKEEKIAIQGLGVFRKKTIQKEGKTRERIVFTRRKNKERV